MLAAWAKGKGWKVVEPRRAARIIGRARAGLHPVTGRPCGIPLAPSSAMKRWRKVLGATGVLIPSVECNTDNGCRLRVSIREGFDFTGKPISELVAPFDAGAAWPDAMARALPLLGPPEKNDDKTAKTMGLLGTLSTGAGNDGIRALPERLSLFCRPTRAADGEKDVKKALSFPGGDAALRSCFAETGSVDLLVETSADGRVVRCESINTDDAVSRCACAAVLEDAVVRRPGRRMRLYVNANYHPADVVTKAGGVVVTAYVNTRLVFKHSGRAGFAFKPVVSDPAIADWAPPADSAVARCFSDAGKELEITATADVVFDPAGRATSARVERTASMTKDQQKCLRKVLMKSRAPCTSGSAATARAKVEVSVRPAGSPRLLPAGLLRGR